MAKDSLIQFKGTSLKIIQILLRSADIPLLHGALAELTGNSPDFFDGELAVLDFSLATDLPPTVDWAPLCQLFRDSGLSVVATHGLPEDLASAATAAGWPALGDDALGRSVRSKGPEAAPHSEAPTPTAPPPPPPPPPVLPPEPAARTVTVDKPLRSGQRFYARGCDLVVTAMISAGAEVIADGNIHIYAPLRGRALAGASGDKSARIFTTCMEAELVSVAGIYRTFEAGVLGELGSQAASISLTEDGNDFRLTVAPLALR